MEQYFWIEKNVNFQYNYGWCLIQQKIDTILKANNRMNKKCCWVQLFKFHEGESHGYYFKNQRRIEC